MVGRIPAGREREVLGLLCRGLTPAQIGAALGIAAGTARIYRRQIRERTVGTPLAVLCRRLGDDAGPPGGPARLPAPPPD